MYKKLLTNTVLVNLTFLLVIIAGWISYSSMPREQDPDVNFNWVVVTTIWPGASAEDVEHQVTNPIEEEIEKVPDVIRVSSSSRVNISIVIIRFAAMDPILFNNRVADLRRAIQSAVDGLPNDVKQPQIIELSSSNTFPTAVIIVSGIENDEIFRKSARNVTKDIARIKGIDRADEWGTENPEIQVNFDPEKLIGLGVSPVALAHTVNAYFRDLSAGSVQIGQQQWQVRLKGTSNDPNYLANLPILTVEGELPLRSVANIVIGQEKPAQLVSYEGKPASMISVFKRSNVNSLELLDNLHEFVAQRNELLKPHGIQLNIADDQTEATRSAINIMETNAVIGFILVMLVTWLFLGWKLALFTSLGLAFSLLGSFWVLAAMGETLNVMVLLGVVIVLGMLVDDAVVVVESAYVNLKRGLTGIEALTATVKQMWVPVLVSSLTTIAAFLPLVLLPGILGQFMRIVPVVVSVSLVISLIEAFWILPSHIVSARVNPSKITKSQQLRNKVINWMRHRYVDVLIPVMRHPKISIATGGFLTILAFIAVMSNVVKVDFFANDPIRLFYLNVSMPPGTSLQSTDAMLKKIDIRIREKVAAKEFRSISTTAGVRLTETEPLFGDIHGQIMFSLPPKSNDLSSVGSLIEEIQLAIQDMPGPANQSFLRRNTGPPSDSPISVKVRGDNIEQLRAATEQLEQILNKIPGIQDINNNDVTAGMQLSVSLNADSITRANLNPVDIAEVLRLYVDGSVVANMRFEGEKWNVRVQAVPGELQGIKSFLSHPVGLKDGSEIALEQLVTYTLSETEGNIHHRNFKRTITLEADIDNDITDTIKANQQIIEKWNVISEQYPDVSLDFSGEMDDIKESLNGMALLFLFGIGLIYMILGTQFKSYSQPLLILATVPMAFTGVIIGLFITNSPLSLYTLYGVIALAGIAANDAIVLISTANQYLQQGMNLTHAIVFAAQRRFIPILMTTLTTIAGLFSLAAGWGGKSLMWGPLATAIVWGLAFSSALTLLLIPPLYAFIMRKSDASNELMEAPPKLLDDNQSIFSPIISFFKIENPTYSESLNEISQQENQKKLYQLGSEAFINNQPEYAIKYFQTLVKQLPSNFLTNIMSTQSLVLYMQKTGWDIGYMARAKRHLARAKLIDANDDRVMALDNLIQELDLTQENIDKCLR